MASFIMRHVLSFRTWWSFTVFSISAFPEVLFVFTKDPKLDHKAAFSSGDHGFRLCCNIKIYLNVWNIFHHRNHSKSVHDKDSNFICKQGLRMWGVTVCRIYQYQQFQKLLAFWLSIINFWGKIWLHHWIYHYGLMQVYCRLSITPMCTLFVMFVWIIKVACFWNWPLVI